MAPSTPRLHDCTRKMLGDGKRSGRPWSRAASHCVGFVKATDLCAFWPFTTSDRPDEHGLPECLPARSEPRVGREDVIPPKAPGSSVGRWRDPAPDAEWRDARLRPGVRTADMIRG